jgi:hypothetical protein
MLKKLIENKQCKTVSYIKSNQIYNQHISVLYVINLRILTLRIFAINVLQKYVIYVVNNFRRTNVLNVRFKIYFN